MRPRSRILLAAVVLSVLAKQAEAGFSLGTAGEFAVLAGTSVTNTGSSVVDGGNIGVSAGTSITGFPPGTLVLPYTFEASTALSTQAHNDLATAYGVAAALTPTQSLTGQDLGGLTLTPGVYQFASSASLTGKLTLNDLGNPNAQFIFQIGSTLTTATDSSVVTINGGSYPGANVFWQIGSSATLGTGTSFEGAILAQTSITLTTGASILNGSALALDGAVTLDTNHINNVASASSVPEPSSLLMMLIGTSLTGYLWKRSRPVKGQSSDGSLDRF